LQGVERLIDVECNSTAQLARLCSFYGIKTDDQILKYDGRPFSLDDLNSELDRVKAGRIQS
jgi:2-oxoglutarate ferredoxin oxidoreductase subunit alpha